MGSISVTSIAAASMTFDSSASASASPSMMGPLAVFTNKAVGFIFPRVSALLRCRDSDVAAQCMLMYSASDKSASRETSSTP